MDNVRRGFTLIELLIVITILAILASLVIGIAALAGQTGREGKTRNLVERVHTLLVDHHNQYKTRRVDLNQNIKGAISNLPSNYTSADRGKITAAARLFALREMMILEMPDRWSDLWLQALPIQTPAMMPAGLSAVAIPPAFLNERTALSDSFLRRLRSLYGRINTISNAQNTVDEILANQSAECLYMIVTMACGEGEARSQFHENDIGDVDGDGAPEFLDAWGHPISFFRWTPGFDSLVQINAYKFGPPTSPDTDAWKAAAARDHDPFDVFRLQPNAYRLMPLVYSAGRDESYGLELNINYVPWRLSNSVPKPQSTVYPCFDVFLDPYITVNSGPGAGTYLGAENVNQPGESVDNIHNQLIGRRL